MFELCSRRWTRLKDVKLLFAAHFDLQIVLWVISVEIPMASLVVISITFLCPLWFNISCKWFHEYQDYCISSLWSIKTLEIFLFFHSHQQESHWSAKDMLNPRWRISKVQKVKKVAEKLNQLDYFGNTYVSVHSQYSYLSSLCLFSSGWIRMKVRA